MLFELSIIPLDQGVSLATHIAKVIAIIKEAGFPYELTAMSTQIEGTWEEVMPLIKKCHEEIRNYSHRVLTSIKIDDREGAAGRLIGKIDDVKKLLP